MKKYVTILLVSLVFLTGCGKKTVDIDMRDLTDELIDNVKFEDSLTEIDRSMSKKIYGIDNASDSIVYISSGATSEEIAIFKFNDKNTAKEEYKKVEARIEKQKKDYASYAPLETKRLDKAIIERKGNYVILCVTDDNEARSIIDKHVK